MATSDIYIYKYEIKLYWTKRINFLISCVEVFYYLFQDSENQINVIDFLVIISITIIIIISWKVCYLQQDENYNTDLINL